MAKVYNDSAFTVDASCEAYDSSVMPTAFLTITKVIHESMPLVARKGRGETIGQLIDARIQKCINEGEEIQEVTLGFDPAQWQAMKENR